MKTKLDDELAAKVLGGLFVFHKRSGSVTYTHGDGTITEHQVLDYQKAWERLFRCRGAACPVLTEHPVRRSLSRPSGIIGQALFSIANSSYRAQTGTVRRFFIAVSSFLHHVSRFKRNEEGVPFLRNPHINYMGYFPGFKSMRL